MIGTAAAGAALRWLQVGEVAHLLALSSARQAAAAASGGPHDGGADEEEDERDRQQQSDLRTRASERAATGA
jgi:hypothetical protein